MTDQSRLMERLRAGETMVVATVVRTRGSTPREVGAKMVIDRDGRAEGTIGGGCGEADVWARAQEVMESGTPEVVEVDLVSDTDDEGGRACGGLMYVHLERVGGKAELDTAAGRAFSIVQEASTETSSAVHGTSDPGTW